MLFRLVQRHYAIISMPFITIFIFVLYFPPLFDGFIIVMMAFQTYFFMPVVIRHIPLFRRFISHCLSSHHRHATFSHMLAPYLLHCRSLLRSSLPRQINTVTSR